MKSLLEYLDAIRADFAATGLAELELIGPEGSVRLVRNQSDIDHHVTHAPTKIGDQPSLPPDGLDVCIKAPSVGFFLRSHPSTSTPLVGLGDIVQPQDVIGFLRLDLLLIPVIAQIHGRITAILAKDQAPVGYGEPLFDIKPLDLMETD